MRAFTIKRFRILAPLAWLYGAVTGLRNRLFDRGWLPSERFPLPVICVGNLSVGGTGKTPHTEYLVRLLSPTRRVAVLSRGYKRETKGYHLATTKSSSSEIGDEPYQIKRKFPEVIVAVDSDRRRGIANLLALPATTRPEVILLDDAFQHRYVRPSLSIVLTDYHRPFFADALMPDGRLRESARGIRRADIVIVSKTDEPIDRPTYKEWRHATRLSPGQQLFFSELAYDDLEPLFPNEAGEAIDPARATVLLISGIANPAPLLAEVGKRARQVIHFPFADHHPFSADELARIEAKRQEQTGPTLIIVTEKDAARLRQHPALPDAWRAILYQLPIRTRFLNGEGERFDQLILRHIEQPFNSKIKHD